MRVVSIHHVQIAIPPGCEDLARAFYGDVLGLPEVPKPPALAGRGGVWYQEGPVRIHLGVDPTFAPASKAHVGLELSELRPLLERLRALGFQVEEAPEIPGYRRAHLHDPFGNRLELLSASIESPGFATG